MEAERPLGCWLIGQSCSQTKEAAVSSSKRSQQMRTFDMYKKKYREGSSLQIKQYRRAQSKEIGAKLTNTRPSILYAKPKSNSRPTKAHSSVGSKQRIPEPKFLAIEVGSQGQEGSTNEYAPKMPVYGTSSILSFK